MGGHCTGCCCRGVQPRTLKLAGTFAASINKPLAAGGLVQFRDVGPDHPAFAPPEWDGEVWWDEA